MKRCIEEIIAVCDKHGLVLSHEDGQGSFLFELKSNLDPQTIEILHNWLRDADLT